jgi:hypothetical protein
MKIYQHIIFWVVVHASLTFIFGKWFQSFTEAFYYVSLLLPVVMGTSYFFNYFLVPRYLFTRRFSLFALYSIYMFIVSLCLELLASVGAMLLIIEFGVSATGPLVTDVFTLAIILYFIVLFKSFILLIKHYFVDQGAIHQLEEERGKMEQGHIMVPSRRKKVRVDYADLLYVESLADYVSFHLTDGSELSSKQKISHLEKELPDLFLRIHRSFIVNTSKISSFNSEEIYLASATLPVSRTYRKAVSSRLKK